MDKLTEEELKNLSQLLVSSDDSNIELGLAILENNLERIPIFHRELVLIVNLHQNTVFKNTAKDMLALHYTPYLCNKWKKALQFLHDIKITSEDSSKLQNLIKLHESFRPKIQAFITSNSDYSYYYYKAARQLHLNIKIELSLAETYYRIHLETSPNDEHCLYCLAYLLADNKKSALEAKDLYERVAAINPNSDGAVNNIGHIYDLHFQDYEKAYHYYEKALAIAPQESRYMRNLSKMYLELKKEGFSEKAKELLLQATEVEPQNTLNWKHLGDYYWTQEKDYELTGETYKKGLNINPKDALLLSNMGELQYLIFKKYTLALTYFEKAIQQKKTLYSLAMICTLIVEHLDNMALAKQYYLSFLEELSGKITQPKYLSDSKWQSFLLAEDKLIKHFPELRS